jgi:DNA-binding response OmpR family regulator
MTAEAAEGGPNGAGTLARSAAILLATHDLRTLVVATARLSRLNLVVRRATSVDEAIAALRERSHAALILDLEPPRWRDGWLVLDIIRLDRSIRRPPILALTEGSTPDDARAALARGADDFIAKPVDPRELAIRVQALIRRAAHEPGRRAGHAGAGRDGRRRRSATDGRPYGLPVA